MTEAEKFSGNQQGAGSSDPAPSAGQGANASAGAPQDDGSLAWPLEAARVSLDDPLMECLAIIAAQNGRRTSAAALSSGLPVHGKQMASPAAFVRAADRIGFTARMLRRPLSDIVDHPSLPCILVLKRDHACILQGRVKDKLQVIFPETPKEEVLRLADRG